VEASGNSVVLSAAVFGKVLEVAMRRTQIILNFLAFLLGCQVLAIPAAVIQSLDPGLPRKVMERWGLEAEPDGRLMIPLGGPSLLSVELECDPDSGNTRSVFIEQPNGGFTFLYMAQGKFGRPTASYGAWGGQRDVMCFDYCCRGRFDERTQYMKENDLRPNLREIWVSGKWLELLDLNSFAETVEGPYEFDPDRGEWRKATQRHGTGSAEAMPSP
jgi:hypothetical protein